MHLRESTGSGENDNEELIAAGYGLLLRAHNQRIYYLQR